MPPNVVLTRGDLRVSDRPANIHPEHWDSKALRYTPLDQYPVMSVLDKMRQGEPVNSRVFHYFEKPFNVESGSISDVYSNTGLDAAHSGAAAEGDTVYIKPESADLVKLHALRKYHQVEIYSTSVRGRVKGYVNDVDPTGSKASFTFTTLEADTNEVLAGTGLTWSIMQLSEDEVFELSEALQQHETEYYNYVYTDSESCSITMDELDETSRLMEDLKKEKEIDALLRLYQRRELTVFEGHRVKLGDRYYSGGLRYFLSQHEPNNIINWQTDTAFSEATDSVLGGTLPFLRKVLTHTRKWSRKGATKVLVVSDIIRDVIDECVTVSGEYRIDYGTNKYGINVGYLRGLDQVLEIWEDPLFAHHPSLVNTAYLIEPENIKRRPKNTSKSGLKFSKGIARIPWSNIMKKNEVTGENFISRIKGGYVVKESYQFQRLAAHAIIDNLGLEKS